MEGLLSMGPTLFFLILQKCKGNLVHDWFLNTQTICFVFGLAFSNAKISKIESVGIIQFG